MMTLQRRITLLVLLCVPLPAWASGGDILSLMWLEFGLFVLVLGSLFMLRLSTPRSLIILFAYLLATFAALHITRDWPYLDNLVTVNTLCIGLPFAAWLLAVIFLRGKRRMSGA